MDLYHIVIGTFSIVLVFGLAVFVHEFGHMIFALIRGVGVESFAVGMGPKIVAWEWKGIEFSLRWFPVGGFVKLKGMMKEEAEAAGENPPETPDDSQGPLTLNDVQVDDGRPDAGKKTVTEASYDDMMALADKGFVTKILVFAGGVFMNFVTAILAMALLLFIGQDMPRFSMEIEKVKPESAAALAGLQPGDRVTAVNGTAVQFDDEFLDAIKDQAKAANIDLETEPLALNLTVERTGQPVQLQVPPIKLTEFREGIELLVPPVIGSVAPHLPADKAGIKPGDRVMSVNGTPIRSLSQMAELVRPQLGKEINVVIRRGTEEQTLKLTPTESLENPTQGWIGVVAGSEFEHKVREANPVKALALAPLATVQQGYNLVMMQVEFFKRATFKQIKENLGGPIAIADLTQRKAREGFPELLMWFINLNLLLATFNLLPLPVLDGGFILLSIIEGIIRRPVSPKILQPIYAVFVIFFILLMVTISLLDIQRFLS